MNDSIFGLANILLVFALVLANGFFVAVEFAMVRARETKLRSPEMVSKFGVKESLKLIKDLDGSLSAVQLGITVASLVLGWWGEHTFQRFFLGMFSWLGEVTAFVMSHSVATALALIVITFLHIVIGELAAKSVAIQYPELTLRVLAWPMFLFSQVCKPLVFFFNGAARLFLKMLRVTAPSDLERVHSGAELAMLISESGAGGLLDKDEEQMLQGVFSFSDTVAREVMTPRTDVVTVSADATLEEVIEVVNESGHSRFPVVGERVDDVLGVLLIKDILPYVSQCIKHNKVKEFDVKRIMRESYFIPGTKRIDSLLTEFKGRKLHIAIVLDEHGGVDGVVTLEDLIEEIFGDIFDESDADETDVIVEEDGVVVVDGGVLVADLNSRFELGLPEGDYDTIAGFIFTQLGRVANEGDRIILNPNGSIVVGNGSDVDGHEQEVFAEAEPKDKEPAEDNSQPGAAVITVEKVENHRVERVAIQRLVSDSPEEESGESLATEPTSEAKKVATGR